MIPVADVYRAARFMIENHGKSALTVAERRAKDLSIDSPEAATIWGQIVEAIRAIERDNRKRQPQQRPFLRPVYGNSQTH